MITEFSKQLQQEAGLFRWKEALLRMAADLALVNFSMLASFALWFLFYDMVLRAPETHTIARHFRNLVATCWLFWSLMALLIFHLSGFYTRTRGYATRYKAWVVFRAVSLFIVSFVFADYLLFRGALLPRGVALLGWLLSLITVGGSRFAKDFFFHRYQVRPRSRPREVERVLVVGGAGYVGAMLVPQLIARGYRVRVFDSLLFGRDSLGQFNSHPHCELVAGDMRDIQAVVQVMKDCDAVIHLAAIVGDPACEQNKELAVEINRAATRMLVDVARGYGITRFLFASTCSVYGASDFLMDERTAIAPLSVYAHTKADSEKILLDSGSPEFHPTVLRLGTLFGLSPRPRFDLVVNLLAARAASLGKIAIFNGGQWRPFLHVEDAARAFLTCLEASPALVSGEVFNVGSYALNLRLADIGERIAALIPGVTVESVENDDRRNYRVSFDKIHTRLGFVCRKTVEDGIREIGEAVRSGRIGDFTAEQYNNHAALHDFARSDAAQQPSLRVLEVLAHDK